MNRRSHALAAPVAAPRRPLWQALAQAGLFLSLAGATLPSMAQSLGALYQSARDFDATYLSARSQYKANLAKAEQGKSALLPTVGLSAGATRADRSQDPCTHYAPSLRTSESNNYYTTQTAGINASQPLYRPANLAA